MHHAYILYSHTCQRQFIGQTDDLDRRLRQHNDTEYTGSKTTKRFPGPWALIHREEFATRSDATRNPIDRLESIFEFERQIVSAVIHYDGDSEAAVT